MLLIDAHLDLSWTGIGWNRDLTKSLTEVRAYEAHMTDHPGRGRAAVTFPEMRRGEVGLFLGTLLCRSKPEFQPAGGHLRRNIDFANQTIAAATARGQLEYYRLLEQQGELTMITNAAGLDAHWRRWETVGGSGTKLPIGMILAMEGADPIITPADAERWFGLGLRTVGLAHFGRSAYAVGTGMDGPLTPAGVELLREFRRLGVILDLTHTADTGFFQALDLFDGPVFASHNNCRALVPGDRQYSDEQLRLLIQRGGVIGAVCDAWMLLPNYRKGETPREAVTLDHVADHIDHVCQLAGDTLHSAIGSDLDGGFGTEQVPAEMDSIADLQKLVPILKSRGYSNDDIANIFHRNWLRFFRTNLPKA